jgi:glycosyltransferase involved in cell wall biosynthesis
MSRIHQFVAGFANGDAISNEAVVMRQVFRSWGFESEIFSELHRILPELRKEARDISAAAAAIRPDDVVLLHCSIGSRVNTVFAELACRKALLYHNITPSHYFDLINSQTAFNLAAGRSQLKTLAGIATVNMADSAFNANELAELGFGPVSVLPLVLDFDRLSLPPDRQILRRFRDGMVNVIFVGRCVPNKKMEDALRAFYYFNRFVERSSRFIHVGSFAGSERYYYLLLALARELDLRTVHFAGSVPQERLNAYYQVSDIFLCMSEHEGFCIPLIESMHHHVPVMAYAAAAVPETMDNAGILFTEKKYEDIAEMMGRLAHDPALRRGVIQSQEERLARYRRRDLASELRTRLQPLLQ